MTRLEVQNEDENISTVIDIDREEPIVESGEEAVDICQKEASEGKIVFRLHKDLAMWKCDGETPHFVAINGVQRNICDLNLNSSQVKYSDKQRYVSMDLFKRRMKNGEMCSRSWLIFSESKGAVF